MAAEKFKLLVLELWGVGDLAIATPFLQAAAKRFEVTLLAKKSALELQPRFWPDVKVIPFTAPWTAFRGKYRFWNWNWHELFALRRKLRAENFEFGLSARPDPRDHPLLKFLGAKKRFGFPDKRSGVFLTNPLIAAEPTAHRYEFWRVAANALDLNLPPREKLIYAPRPSQKTILVHTGAAQPVRVWLLENYFELVRRLRENGWQVQAICDVAQRDTWLQSGEKNIVSPNSLTELISLFDRAAAFIGNDSGPGHLAAVSGVPTFTFFGPQLASRFLPLHPQAKFVEDNSCPYKPCKDYCHFPTPRCMENITLENVWPRIQTFAQEHYVAKG